jgi:hypothetical protein
LRNAAGKKPMSHKVIVILAGLAVLLQACDSAQDQPATAVSESTSNPTSVAPRTPAPTNARVFFVTPANGETVSSPVLVKFGLEGLNVAPAGTYEPETGHHHLLIDTQLPVVNLPVPADENHIHFGKGQTETMVELSPGSHTLQLLVGDGNHVPHQPPVTSEAITITVE